MVGYIRRTWQWVWVLRMCAVVPRDETEMARVHKPAPWIAFRGGAKGARGSSDVPVFHSCACAVFVEVFDAAVALPCSQHPDETGRTRCVTRLSWASRPLQCATAHGAKPSFPDVVRRVMLRPSRRVRLRWRSEMARGYPSEIFSYTPREGFCF